MKEPRQEVQETVTVVGHTTQKRQEVLVPRRQGVPTKTIIPRVIRYVTGVLLVVLGLRFVLALLGANPTNAFANFIYSASHPFVSPFFSLFGYSIHYGVSQFEMFTLVAMAIYALIAYGLVKLVTITR
ncbi:MULTISPECIES: YggT family protein [Acidithrix]|uniref:YGGT family protein n=2 Tax=root TaxID=1 RepID=A0A0D8HH85_9ACTN|nr:MULTISPECIES: YggT family protein [Acidithrix]KJF17219.1 hypothetical protein AXFE_19320 [Acidithrix ferrooxidans]CAG4914053.1 unnamed protein product [Acidithrix sp. C25]